MMAGVFLIGALFLVILAGASYSYPVKQGFDHSASYSSSYGSNPASAGSTWDAPSSGKVAVAAPGTGATSVPNPAHSLTAPRRTGYPQPSLQRAPPAASSSSSSLTAPEYSGYPSSSSAGSQSSALQPMFSQAIPWAVAPSGPFSGEEASTRPSAHQFVSTKPAPEPLGPSNVTPSGPFTPAFQAGELSKMEKIYEHGNYESETEEQGFQPPPPVDLNGEGSTSELQPAGPGRSWVEYPYDYMLRTGRYPPGTITHSISSFEQGTNHWQDTHYIRDYFPAEPETQPDEAFPAYFEAPQSLEHPSQPVKQPIGSTSYGWSGAATGQDQPYGSARLQGYFQPGAFEPHQRSPAGGYGFSKVGY